MKSFFFIVCFTFCFTLSANTHKKPLNNKDFTSPVSIHAFEENKGQVVGMDDNCVLYVHKTAGMSMFLLPTGIAYQFNKYAKSEVKSEELSTFFSGLQLEAPREIVETHRMDMELIGANPNAKVMSMDKSKDYSNYNSLSITNVHSYKRIIYENIYPDIDWVIYQTDEGIKYDFIVKPNGDPKKIQIKSKWVDEISLDDSGNLLMKNRLGSVLEKKPVSFQQDEIIETNFILKDDVISFDVSNYDCNEKLIIDPEIEWGTYYGGEGTDGLSSVTTDALGNVYACGITYGSDGLAIGGFQNNNPALIGGIGAAFLVKFNSEGERIWATYYGGGDFTGAISVEVDLEQNVYIAGFTMDLGLGFNGFQNSYNGNSDGILVKFNSEGERLWSTYLGGSDTEVCRKVAIDNLNNVYVTGRTTSNDFPVLNGYQETSGDDFSGDAFLTKFDPSGNLIWSTYYGGSQQEFGFYVTCDDSNNVFITGRTASTSNIFLNSHQSEYGGGQTDAFLAKYDTNGILLWSTYYGGSGEDIAYGCATDNNGNVIITGETGSNNNIEFNGFQQVFAAAFLAKFSSDGELKWGTYYGSGNSLPGSGDNVGYACTTDLEDNVYMAGGTSSTSNIAFEGFQNNYSGGSSDGFIVQFTPAGDRAWGSYYGGSNNDYIRGLHVDAKSDVYIAGTTQSSDGIFFNGFQSTQENETGFAAKINTCPSPTLINLPEEICAGGSLILNPFPSGGTFQVIGEGEIFENTYTAPDVVNSTFVTLEYIIDEEGVCPGATSEFELLILPIVEASAEIITSAEVICQNDSVIVQANIENGGSAPNIKWLLNGELVQEGGGVFISTTLNDNDVVEIEVESSYACPISNPILSNAIVFSINPNPNVSLVFSDLQGGILVTDSGFASYQWFLDGQLIPGANSSSLIPTSNGEYKVIVTNEFGCESSVSLPIVTVSLQENSIDKAIIYPNPSSGNLTIEFGLKSPEYYTISNSIGEIVYLNNRPKTIEQLDLSDLNSGLYIIVLYSSGMTSTKKIILQ